MPNLSLSMGFVTESLWSVVETCLHRSRGNLSAAQRWPQPPEAKLAFKNKELDLLSELDSR
jgi:hypothetical protein